MNTPEQIRDTLLYRSLLGDACRYVKNCLYESGRDFTPSIGLVLGSGLGNFANSIENPLVIPYGEIPHFPVSTAPGHAGCLILGTLQGIPVACMQGRVHYYEGYPMKEVVFPVRMLAKLGAKTLILTCASGGIDPAFRPGDLMLIRDHISAFVPSPLIGPNDDSLGTRFPDMSHVYDPALLDMARDAAVNLRVHLREGVYLQTTGPQFETPTEIHMYRAMGADAVGMSTVCEAIAAVHCGMRVCGISCISNMAAGMTPGPLSGDDVNEVSARSGPRYSALITELVRRIGAGEV